jgi:hypothetical protein
MSLTKYIPLLLETKEISEQKLALYLQLFNKLFPAYLSSDHEKIKAYRDYIFKYTLSVDPTPNKSYYPWLLKNFFSKYSDGKGGMVYNKASEDSQHVLMLLDLYFKKRSSKEMASQYKDISNIKGVQELERAVSPWLFNRDTITFLDGLERSGAEFGVDYDILHDDSETAIYQPLTELGGCAVGAKSNWCTSGGEHSLNPDLRSNTNYMDNYEDSKIYTIWIKKTDIVYQIEFETPQYMNSNNEEVGLDSILNEMSEDAKQFLLDEIDLERLFGFTELSVHEKPDSFELSGNVEELLNISDYRVFKTNGKEFNLYFDVSIEDYISEIQWDDDTAKIGFNWYLKNVKATGDNNVLFDFIYPLLPLNVRKTLEPPKVGEDRALFYSTISDHIEYIRKNITGSQLQKFLQEKVNLIKRTYTPSQFDPVKLSIKAVLKEEVLPQIGYEIAYAFYTRIAGITDDVTIPKEKLNVYIAYEKKLEDIYSNDANINVLEFDMVIPYNQYPNTKVNLKLLAVDGFKMDNTTINITRTIDESNSYEVFRRLNWKRFNEILRENWT